MRLSPDVCGDLLADHYRMFSAETIQRFERIIAQSLISSTLYLVDRGMIASVDSRPVWGKEDMMDRRVRVNVWRRDHGYEEQNPNDKISCDYR